MKIEKKKGRVNVINGGEFVKNSYDLKCRLKRNGRTNKLA